MVTACVSSNTMDKGWLKSPRSSSEFGHGVSSFIVFALSNSERNNRILCPCRQCGNRYWLGHTQVHEHLICYGFMFGYNTWIFHGEKAVRDEDPVEYAAD